MMGAVLPFPRDRMTLQAEAFDEHAAPRDDNARWGAWMCAAQSGDRAAYHALLTAITPYLRAIAQRYLGRDDAEDAVQDILIVMHDIRHTFEPGRPFKPWLATIATRRCIDTLRKRTRRTVHEMDDEAIFDTLPDAGLSPEEALGQAQQAHAIRRAVGRLSPKMREAVRLVHLDELSLDEAAVRAGQTSGAVKVAAHRALNTLRAALRVPRSRDD